MGLAVVKKKKIASKKTYLLRKPNIDHNWQRENCMDKQNCWINKSKLYRKLTLILYSGKPKIKMSHIFYIFGQGKLPFVWQYMIYILKEV